jgi:NAD(P)-dependent dehydrogenase (short-subunit alcohol dehydrogenase family)
VKVVVIGASGTIGTAVVAALGGSGEVVPVSRSTAPLRVDISSADSVQALFAALGPFDALVCATGKAKFGPLANLSDADFEFSLANKLMGQVNLVRFGSATIRDKGSFTLTSGVLASEPAPGTPISSLVNAGIEGFVRAAALELGRGVRINAVSPPWVRETLVAMGQDGADGMPAAEVAAAYLHSVHGGDTGRVIDARAFRGGR